MSTLEETAGVFRKKPVEVEARRVPVYTDPVTDYLDRCIALAEWCGGASHMMHSDGDEDHDHIAIDTPEGTMEALPGDWVIRGVKGEFYPCKPEIFEATYSYVGPVPTPLSRRMSDAAARRRADMGAIR